MTKIAQALEVLKKNQSYQILVEELKRIQSNCEDLIYDEKTPIEQISSLRIKRNTIKNFIELPDDLINIETLKDVSATDSSEG